jgi:glycosyltransferase involved in cell wall biosynthesis
MAACIDSPLPWDRLHYIPNFAPSSPVEPDPTGFPAEIDRIVFPRRFEPHRGTRLIAGVLQAIVDRGWPGEIELIGGGTDETFLRNQFHDCPNVRIHRLPFDRRMEAYDDRTLVVIPSLSTEGTSLACLEGWSRGALILATGVGGLANLVLDGHNGLLIRPLAADLFDAIDGALSGRFDNAGLKQRGYETFTNGFSEHHWCRRWTSVFEKVCGLTRLSVGSC